MGFQGGGVRVRQDFTDNKEQLQEAVETLVFGEDKDGDGIPDQLEEGTAFGQDDAEFSILNTDRQLAALQTAVGMLRPLPDQKSLVYFARDRKSTRLNSSHLVISYAVFCLKKKKTRILKSSASSLARPQQLLTVADF